MLGMTSINKYKATIESQNLQITNLEASLLDIGGLVTGYVVTEDVRAGEQITAENIDNLIQEVSVPAKINLQLIEPGENGDTTILLNRDDLVGKYFKIGLQEGTVLTVEDIVADPPEVTERYYDIILDELPVGLQAGDFIDIRILFPFGEDFIAMSKKQVLEINAGVLKLVVDEKELMVYNSMLLDKALYPAAKIYAIEYIDAGYQTHAEIFYPVQKNLAEITTMDPNILEEVKQEMLLRREVLDAAIGGSPDELTEKELEKVEGTIKSARNKYLGSLSAAQKALDKRLAAEAKAAEKASKN